MTLYVFLVEARGLPSPAAELAGAFAKLRVGNHNSRTRTVSAGADPAWNEEFVFRVGDGKEDEEELEVGVFREGCSRGERLLGHLRVSISRALGEERCTLPPTWFSLQPKDGAHVESKTKDCGRILLSISLYGSASNTSLFIHTSSPRPSFSSSPILGQGSEAAVASPNILRGTDTSTMTTGKKTQLVQALPCYLADDLLNKNEQTFTSVSRSHDPPDISGGLFCDKRNTDETFSGSTFAEAIKIMEAQEETDLPENLDGGVLHEETYSMEPKDMNSLLFEPNSQFRKDLVEQQGITDYHEGPWVWDSTDMQCFNRSVTYTKSATKFLKAVRAVEEQTYLKADGKNFAVWIRVNTPDVPYGGCFEIDLLYKIIPGLQLSSGEECSHLVISWKIDFSQSTMMKGIIEGTARQELKESYEKFAGLLAQCVRPVNSSELPLHKEQLLAPLQLDHHSDMEMAMDYLCNFTVVSTIFMGLYVLLHILLSGPGKIRGLEFCGLDLPDTFSELLICGILYHQGEKVLNMISHFVQARLQRGSDHGVKAQGDGWLLTVALVEGSTLPSIASPGLSDPYVVFSCNGKTRTSSVQLQTLDPQWNEILEFDAMQEPPSVLDVEIFDFDGPFDLSVSLGHAQINFLKHSSAELADMWVPLEGKLAQTSHTKLHLRIFLENTKGVETIREYLTKMEKEVGKKLNMRSPHRNSTFQKHFGLPPEEFLVNDFSCYLRKKIPLQGKIFLSARIVGFHSNLFGHKTKFFFLWEDIENIQMVPPSLATVGSPALLITLKRGRGLDARHGAKSQDEEGRLRFQFQGFMSFNIASRTIMALWRTRTLTNYEQNAKLEEDPRYQVRKLGQNEEDTEFFMSTDDNAPLAFAATVSMPMKHVMEVFGGGDMERKLMEKVGCLNYSVSRWEAARSSDAEEERHIHYKFNRQTSIFGGEVTSTQKKNRVVVDGNGWVVDEIMALHNIPFGDHFRVFLRYKLEEVTPASCGCNVFVGIKWMKSTKFQKRITRNICNKLGRRSQEMFELAESQIL